MVCNMLEAAFVPLESSKPEAERNLSLFHSAERRVWQLNQLVLSLIEEFGLSSRKFLAYRRIISYDYGMD